MRVFTISRHGFSLIGFLLLGALIAWFFSLGLMVAFLCLALFTAFFFRNPKRTPPPGESKVVAPADGQIMDVSQVVEPYFVNKKMTRVRIFLSLLDVHMNRMPLQGKILDKKYFPGKYYLAWKDKASQENERHAILMDHEGSPFIVVQISGFVARRIVSEVETGMLLSRGEQFGMIKLGSCTELYLPPEVNICVGKGDKVKAGETVIADLPQ